MRRARGCRRACASLRGAGSIVRRGADTCVCRAETRLGACEQVPIRKRRHECRRGRHKCPRHRGAAMKVAILPVKARAEAKQRLAGLLTAAQREALARILFEEMLGKLMAARGIDRVVVATSEQSA